MKADILRTFLQRTKLIFIIVSMILALCLYFFVIDKIEPAHRNIIIICGVSAFIILDILVVFKLNGTLVLGILLAGLISAYFIVCPVGMAPDEETHFYRAYEVSNGYMLSKHIRSDGTGGNVFPGALRDFRNPEKVIDENVTEDFIFGNTSLYSPVTYAPQAIAIKIADVFTNKPYELFLAGRFGGAAFAFVLCIFALYFAPFGKKLLFLVMTFPLTLQEMISMSPDGTLIALALFLTSYVLYIVAKKEKMLTVDMIIIAVAVWLLSLNKIVYVLFSLLVLMIPKEYFKSSKQSMIFKRIVIISAFVLNIIWLIVASGYLVEFRPGVNSFDQIKVILSNPVRFMGVVVNTVTKSPDWVPNMISAGMGSYDIPTHPLIWMTVFALIVYEICDTVPDVKNISNIVPFILLIIFFGVLGLTCTCLYVQWTEVGIPMIVGMQGRYFTPVLICFMYAISIIRTKYEGLSKLNTALENPYYLALFMLFCNLEILAEVYAHFSMLC